LHHQADYHPMIFLSQPWKRPWQMTDPTNPKRLPGASEARIALVAINIIYIYMYIGNMISYGNVWLLNIIINIWIWYWIVIFFVISMGCHQQCSKFVLTRKPIYVSYWYLSIYYVIDRPVYLRSTDTYILCVI
jgi:hypothetical protein